MARTILLPIIDTTISPTTKVSLEAIKQGRHVYELRFPPFFSLFFFPLSSSLWPYPQMLRARGNYLLLTLKQAAIRPQRCSHSPYHYFLLLALCEVRY